MLLILRFMTSVDCVTCTPHAIKAVEIGLLARPLSFLLVATGIVVCSLVGTQKCIMLLSVACRMKYEACICLLFYLHGTSLRYANTCDLINK